MTDKTLSKVDFNIIRYANCWEDVDVLLKGINAAPGSKILSIASGGDNSFSLLVTNPEIVVAVDINQVQLYLVELKKEVISSLEHEEALAFMGFRPSGTRLQVFNKIKNQLSAEAKSYWESNPGLINSGIIYSGKFEKYFQLFCNRILPLIHSKKKVEDLFKEKSEEAQKCFYADQWNTWRWKLLFRIFFSNFIMGRFGRDPEFLKQVKVNVSKTIYKKAANQLSSVRAQQNEILYFSLHGHFGKRLPHYMQKENFDIIKKNIGRLVLQKGSTNDAIKKHERFDCMNLSNIFEYMPQPVFKETALQMLEGINKGGRLCYWNLMVPARISSIFPGEAKYQSALSGKLSGEDKGFFYNCFIAEEKL